MNDRLSAKLNMFVQVKEITAQFKPSWQVNPAFSKAVETVSKSVEGINKLNSDLQGSDTGSTESKIGQKEHMADIAMKISGALMAYAYTENLNELISDAALNRDEVIKAKDVDADDIALHIYNLATKYTQNLEDYGIVQADLDALQASIQLFTNKIGSPRLNQSQRKVIRQQQEILFSEADKALQNIMDNLIIQFRKKDYMFYESYQNARSVIRNGGGPIAKSTKKETALVS